MDVHNRPVPIWGDDALIQRVARHHLVNTLEADAQARLLKGGLYRIYATGDHIIQEGETQSMLFLVLEGAVEVQAEAAGAALARLGPGAILGEVEVLQPGRRIASVVALEPVAAACFGGQLVRELAQQNPRFRQLLEQVGGSRQKQTDRATGES